MSYVANTPDQRAAMLKVCGASSIAELFECIPDSLRPASFDLPDGKSELEVINMFRDLGHRNYSYCHPATVLPSCVNQWRWPAGNGPGNVTVWL